MKADQTKPQVHVAAALIFKNDRFLACHRTKKKAHGDKWEFVGGKIEKGETPQEALIRECREELDIAVRPLSVFAQTTYEYPDIRLHFTVFLTEITQGEPKLLEHDQLAWVRVCDIPSYDFSDADQEIIQKILQHYS